MVQRLLLKCTPPGRIIIIARDWSINFLADYRQLMRIYILHTVAQLHCWWSYRNAFVWIYNSFPVSQPKFNDAFPIAPHSSVLGPQHVLASRNMTFNSTFAEFLWAHPLEVNVAIMWLTVEQWLLAWRKLCFMRSASFDYCNGNIKLILCWNGKVSIIVSGMFTLPCSLLLMISENDTSG